jgi:N-dimethylarginine dimethylaminohydrolase
VLVQHARDALGSQARIDAQWRGLGFTSAPDLGRAIEEYDRFLDILTRSGAQIETLPGGTGLTLDSMYVRDASLVTGRGVVLCRMGKPQRGHEPDAQAARYRELGIPILGRIEPPGRLEGGDLVWLDDRTVAVGRGYRTNDAGIEQLRALLGDLVGEVIAVALPHWRGPEDVFHLMSILSPIDRDLAVAYSPLMPVAFRQRLLERGVALIEVPHDEFETMGANVLALGPRRCVMLAGNPQTHARLERAGVEVVEYEGREISLKGGGGPTCLTRPLERVRAALARSARRDRPRDTARRSARTRRRYGQR